MTAHSIGSHSAGRIRDASLRRGVAAVAIAALGAASGLASGQLTPQRLYYGVDRAVPMTAAAEGGGESASARVLLFDDPKPTGETEPIASAPAELGAVDLAELFPQLWEEDQDSVLFAQLEVDGERVGPAVVLQPLLSVDYATLREQGSNRPTDNPRAGTPVFLSELAPNRPVVYSGLRAYPERHAVLRTNRGDITARLRPDAAPNTAFNFRHLASGGFYHDIIFHRIVETLPDGNPFVIQVGDPTGTGGGGPGYQVDLELSPIPHEFGVLSMARSSDPNSNGSQFFIALGEVPFLNRLYTTFGEVIGGAETIVEIASVEVDEGDRPLDPPVLLEVELVDAPPYGTADVSRVERPAAAGTAR